MTLLKPRSAAPALFLMLLSASGCPGAAGGGGPCVRLPGCESSIDICCDAERVCEERVCQGVGYICSVDAVGVYSWVDRAALCDDKNPCTVDDLCVNGRCLGLPMPCDMPPKNRCTDDVTLETYELPGSCVNGVCEYTKKAVTCGEACEDGSCTGEPCKGVDCSQAPDPCQIAPGRCVQGVCEYDKRSEGTGCTPKDPCELSATCDASGTCKGTLKDCTVPHAKDATCVAGTGACQGYACDKGYRDCNGDMAKDGCETKVSNSSHHCGKCNSPCKDGNHAKARCISGTCKLICDSGWGDCDGKISNGCERRLGPATCDKSGTNTKEGCGVAYCGQGTSKGGHTVVNFKTWHCSFCAHCKKRAGKYSWCLFESDTGVYSSSTCTTCCNDSLTNPTCQ
ncbi:MAG: hypothetical protein CSB49_03545 [Proteobacteria bacterium]|nr:MAG: hypothetical protein CSB49_03545 [Pseudomonadota bacterium]